MSPWQSRVAEMWRTPRTFVQERPCANSRTRTTWVTFPNTGAWQRLPVLRFELAWARLRCTTWLSKSGLALSRHTPKPLW
jgi:hypothetical protein